MLQPFYNKDIFPHCAPFSPFHDFHRRFKKDLLSIHPIFCCFSGSQQEQSKHRHPDLPFPGHLLQLFWEDTEALLKPKPRDIICPAYRGPPHSRICPKHLNWLLSVWRTSPSSLSPLVSWMIETRAHTLLLSFVPDLWTRLICMSHKPGGCSSLSLGLAEVSYC